MFQQDISKKIENFSSLSDTECALILQNHFVEALENEDSYFEWELVSKIMAIGYELREFLTNLLQKATERNMQIIANAPISNWIREYNLKFPLATRKPDSFFEFATHDPRVRNMNDKDRISLMRILRIYDYLLISPPFDMEDNAVSAILKYRLSPEKSLVEIKKEIMSSISDYSSDQISASRVGSTRKIDLKSALQQFPKIGEQTISSSPLNIKSFDRPVRPSIRNWLYDYTSHLGQTGHSSMDRTSYLFRSENTRSLDSPEREKLGIILKSFDENTPLPVDASRNEVVFEDLETRSKKLEGENKRPPVSLTQQIVQQPKMPRETFIKPYPKPGAQEPRAEKPAENISNVRFAEGLPKPKRPVSQPSLPPQPQTKSAIPQKISFARPRKNIIQPIGRRPRPEPKIEGNVVDLSDKNS
ncbi:MAG: hypothetical protein COZ28_02285 [Candidatus Moranbacteria bacterium CG_4_10_14_3_um_filter_44_15]|nr:MAG: hypothetical protein COS72_01700 [Candidatus Moranbacteria bacterium CG06_land_8_20_14_3_00_43_56]PIW93563.1 MAG: hypothetical protein COZ87_00460 [Candidatus Moranbacteria bacterium CG_4_8_14_3_um_filter_43_15]PIX90686.1 MAG: hypothetical protein COZ28_02285 [Candidatus Moranbacteria bacterium CG_4_10_14_3_um_filter_44_15]